MGNISAGPSTIGACCAEEGARLTGEFTLQQVSSFLPDPDEEDRCEQGPVPGSMVEVKSDNVCRRASIEPLAVPAFAMPSMLDRSSLCQEQALAATKRDDFEALSYTPVCFDEGVTFDYERSHQRYSKIVVHSTRARTQRRSQIWEEWMRAAIAGRPIVLLCGLGGSLPVSDAQSSTDSQHWPQGHDQDQDDVAPQEKSTMTVDSRDDFPGRDKTTMTVFSRVSASYFLDRSCTMLSIVRLDGPDSDDGSRHTGTPSTTATTPTTCESGEHAPLRIPVANIQVICPASEFMLLFEEVNTHLSDQEKNRAVLLQYTNQEDVRKRVCFLEDSEAAKDSCIQALTALWLETRNNHSMWF